MGTLRKVKVGSDEDDDVDVCCQLLMLVVSTMMMMFIPMEVNSGNWIKNCS